MSPATSANLILWQKPNNGSQNTVGSDAELRRLRQPTLRPPQGANQLKRRRILSSPNVIDGAERIGRKILDTYLGPDRSFLELREMVNNNSIDILNDFTEACREELESLRTQQL